MHKRQRLLPFVLPLLAVVVLAAVYAVGSQAQEAPAFLWAQPGAEIPQRAESEALTVQKEKMSTAVGQQLALKDAFVGLPAAQPDAAVAPEQDSCFQFIANPQLDVVDLGDGTGSAEPWVVFEPRVYADFDTNNGQPDYYFYFVDGDNDPSPVFDAFAQGILMPARLSYLGVSYDTTTLNPNATDKAYGELYTLNDQGNLKDFIAGWEVPESGDSWIRHTAETSERSVLDKLEGQPIALIFSNNVNGNNPLEAVFFDNIVLTACIPTAGGRGLLYLPSIMNNFGRASGPICLPPTEQPKDEYNKNRGVVQTGAVCNSDLSRTDTKDYYTYQPSRDGRHTLHLRNLPDGSNWQASIYADPPGDSPVCFIGTPGDGDKSTACMLTRGKAYFVMVSAGANYSGPKGNYVMQITGP